MLFFSILCVCVLLGIDCRALLILGKYLQLTYIPKPKSIFLKYSGIFCLFHVFSALKWFHERILYWYMSKNGVPFPMMLLLELPYGPSGVIDGFVFDPQHDSA